MPEYDLPMEGSSGGAAQPELSEREARALFENGATLMAQRQLEAAIDTFDLVIERYGDQTELGLRKIVANSLILRADSFDKVGRWKQAVAAYDEVERRYRDAVEPEFHQLAVSALLGQVNTLVDNDQRAEATEAAHLMVERYGQEAEPKLRELAGWALFQLGNALVLKWRQPAVAIQAFDQIVEICGQAAEPELCALTARALVNKSAALGMMGDTEAAEAANALVLERYGDSADPELGKIVTTARQNRAGRGEFVEFLRIARAVWLAAISEAGWYGWVKRMVTRRRAGARH
jgi:tetratricopeptide (TPR) repeat protein